jgi:hypothetical protein
MSHATEGQEVVLTQAEHLDVADQHELVVVGLEARLHDRRRVHAQAGEELRVRPRHPGRRLAQPVAIGVLAEGDEDLPYRRLDPLEVNGILDR